jgi:hypothetical protein
MEQARQLRLVPSTRTNRHHERWLHRGGHLRPYIRQGNRRATSPKWQPRSRLSDLNAQDLAVDPNR